MNAAALFSGGKDSTLAIHEAIKGGISVKHLISIIPVNPDSYMFHHPNIKITQLLAEAMEIPLIQKPSKGEKEEELTDLKEALFEIKRQIDSVVVGALESQYQKERVDNICRELNLRMISPLWGSDRDKIWERLLLEEFKVMITKVAADGLDQSWLGKIIDNKNVNDFMKLCKEKQIHPGGEGGEFETTVIDCPLYKKRLEIIDSRIDWQEDSGTFIIKNAILLEKGRDI